MAIVTGGSTGIGLETARRLAREGARVIAANRHPLSSEELGEGIVPVACDVAKEADVLACVEEAYRHFGRWDVMVNDAGMESSTPLAELTAEDWTRVLAVNLVGPALFTREALRRMERGGSIVNVSSIHAYVTRPGAGPYSASKAGLLSLTRSAAVEGFDRGVRANAVVPGPTATDSFAKGINAKPGAPKPDPGQMGRPEDVAAAIAYLASDEAASTTGAEIRVDNGWLVRL